MGWIKAVSGAMVIILAVFMARFGELDDAPGLVLISILFAIFGLSLMITSIRRRNVNKK